MKELGFKVKKTDKIKEDEEDLSQIDLSKFTAGLEGVDPPISDRLFDRFLSWLENKFFHAHLVLNAWYRIRQCDYPRYKDEREAEDDT